MSKHSEWMQQALANRANREEYACEETQIGEIISEQLQEFLNGMPLKYISDFPKELIPEPFDEAKERRLRTLGHTVGAFALQEAKAFGEMWKDSFHLSIWCVLPRLCRDMQSGKEGIKRDE